MADDENEVTRNDWLIEPPDAGQVRVVVELGEGAELTPDAQESLEALMRQLNEAEVEGHAFNTGFASFGLFGGIKLQGTCQKLVCDRHDCERHTCDQYKSIRRY